MVECMSKSWCKFMYEYLQLFALDRLFNLRWFGLCYGLLYWVFLCIKTLLLLFFCLRHPSFEIQENCTFIKRKIYILLYRHSRACMWERCWTFLAGGHGQKERENSISSFSNLLIFGLFDLIVTPTPLTSQRKVAFEEFSTISKTFGKYFSDIFENLKAQTK